MSKHQLGRDSLRQLEKLTPDESGCQGVLVMVMARIEHHVLEEESEAFTRLALQLGPMKGWPSWPGSSLASGRSCSNTPKPAEARDQVGSPT